MLTGELQLEVALRDETDSSRSVITAQRHQGALRVLRPFYPDASGHPLLTIVNPGGGYLGGDRYRLDARLQEAASLTLTTQSATKVYRTPQGPACMEQHFELGSGARLEFVPDSIIAYRGASYRQRTEVAMHPSASLVLAEVVTPGWSPDGALFAFDDVALSTRVTVSGIPLVVDRLQLEPAVNGTEQLMLGGFTHLATLLVVDPRANDAEVASLRDHLGIKGRQHNRSIGITRLSAPGFMLRALTRSTPEADGILRAAIDWMRAQWHGQPALNLRKP